MHTSRARLPKKLTFEPGDYVLKVHVETFRYLVHVSYYVHTYRQPVPFSPLGGSLRSPIIMLQSYRHTHTHTHTSTQDQSLCPALRKYAGLLVQNVHTATVSYACIGKDSVSLELWRFTLALHAMTFEPCVCKFICELCTVRMYM